MTHRPSKLQSKEIGNQRESDAYLDELAEIKAELCSLNRAVSRVLEHSGHQQMNVMLSEIRNDFSRPLISYMLHDTRNTLDSNMPGDCEQKEICRSAFENLFQELSLLLLDREADEGKLLACQARFDGLLRLAGTANCDACITHASMVFRKQMELLRSVNGPAKSMKEPGKTTSINALPDEVVSSICEPLANRQRLLILKNLSVETKSFSELSRITGLRGGNLLFHLQKLLDTDMIIQRTERGDYLLTNRGYSILEGIAELYDRI